MTKVRIFLSFEFEKDSPYHQRFFAEAKQHSQYKMIDRSLNEPYHPDAEWLQKARKQISLSDIVIVVIGQDTHNAPGVEKEVTVAGQLYKPRFQVRPKNSTGGAVPGGGEEIPWKWKRINEKISECLKD